MAEPINIVVAIDEDSNEAIYVDGTLVEPNGPTVYACDIAEASGGNVIRFSRIHVAGDDSERWPDLFDDLKVLPDPR